MPKNSTTGAFSIATSVGGGPETCAVTRVDAFTEIPIVPGAGKRTLHPAQTIASEMSDDGRMGLSSVLAFHSVLVCVALYSGCVKQLPPAPIPEPIAPSVQPAPPPPQGYGRLVVDVVEGPTPVQQIRMDSTPIPNATGRESFRFFEVPALLCSPSPCANDMPAGNVLLGFPVIGREGTEVELVNIGPDPSVYRRSLSVYTDDTGGLRVFGIIATSVGAASAITGTALLPIGLAKDNDGLTTAGALSLGLGAALITFGIWAIRHDAPTFRPGSSNHFPLAPQ